MFCKLAILVKGLRSKIYENFRLQASWVVMLGLISGHNLRCNLEKYLETIV
jgi:hypothetical protein